MVLKRLLFFWAVLFVVVEGEILLDQVTPFISGSFVRQPCGLDGVEGAADSKKMGYLPQFTVGADEFWSITSFSIGTESLWTGEDVWVAVYPSVANIPDTGNILYSREISPAFVEIIGAVAIYNFTDIPQPIELPEGTYYLQFLVINVDPNTAGSFEYIQTADVTSSFTSAYYCGDVWTLPGSTCQTEYSFTPVTEDAWTVRTDNPVLFALQGNLDFVYACCDPSDVCQLNRTAECQGAGFTVVDGVTACGASTCVVPSSDSSTATSSTAGSDPSSSAGSNPGSSNAGSNPSSDTPSDDSDDDNDGGSAAHSVKPFYFL